MNKRDTIIYRVATIIFGLMLLAGGLSYFFNYEHVAGEFGRLGVTTDLIYPLAVAKVLGVIAIWFIPNKVLKTAAYIGFYINLISAVYVHIAAADGEFFGPIVPMLLLTVSYIYYRRSLKAAL